MNTTPPDDRSQTPVAPSEPPRAPEAPATPLNWRQWARRLLYCNPFYLCSAALLLLGVNRLSVDPGFLADETQNLFFNFFSLEGYGILLVVTAIVLARRRIWYDSALLVVLDHGLVLVPFMLISQASLIGGNLATILTVAGGVLVCARVLAQRLGYPGFNLPSRAAALGALILTGNVLLPRIFRPWIEKDVVDWTKPNDWLWWVVLPLVVAGANALPRSDREGEHPSQRRWLPLFVYALWTAGTGMHFWCLQHICSLPFVVAQLAPAAWVAAWSLRRRISDCVPELTPAGERVLLVLPACIPLLAPGVPECWTILAGANALAFAALAWHGHGPVRALAVELALLSVALSAAGLPDTWTRPMFPVFDRAHAVAGAGALYAVIQALRRARPEMGALGALAFGLVVAYWTRPLSWHWAMQAGCAFLLVHSLAWDEPAHSGARPLRLLVTSIWLMDAGMMGARLTLPFTVGTAAAASVVLAGWFIRAWLRRDWHAWTLPIASLLVGASGPLNWLFQKGSAGVVALLGSLALFAAGTVTAWTRHRWSRNSTCP